jgi:hypothetical protein
MSRSDPPQWLFSCDPGLVSGVGVLRWTPERGIQKFESFEGSMDEVGEGAEQFLERYLPEHAEVVAERFVITPRTGELSSPDWSLKVCGMLEWLVWKHWGLSGDDGVIYQSAGDAKRLVPNPMLKRADIWHRGGAGHARDALRHGLYRYATAHKILDAWASLT